MKSLRAKIMFFSLVVLLITCISITLLNYRSASKAIIKNVKEVFPQFAKEAAQIVESRMNNHYNNYMYKEDVIDTSNLCELISDIRIFSKGNVFMVDKEGTIIAHNNHNLIGEKHNEQTDSKLRLLIKEKMVKGETGWGEYEYNGLIKCMGFTPIKNTGWSIAVTAPQEEILSNLANLKLNSTMAIVIILAIDLIVTFFLTSSISNPIKEVIEDTERIAQGDLTIRVNRKNFKRNDEIGLLARSISKMLNNLREMASGLVDISEQLSASSEEFSASGDEIAISAEQVTTVIQDVAAGTEEQSVQIDQTKENINDLLKKLVDAGKMYRKMNEQANKAMNSIKTGNKCIKVFADITSNVKTNSKDVAQTIKSLGELSYKIGDIINLINGISSQTSLLALNAAIEAARAGEAGRGFSVVADEIRELAENSSNATEKISDLIKEIQGEVSKAVEKTQQTDNVVDENLEAINSTGEAFMEINELAGAVSDFIEELTISNQKIKANSEEMVVSMNKVAEVSQQAASNSEEVAAASEEQSAAIEEIASSSRQLIDMADKLTVSMARFKL